MNEIEVVVQAFRLIRPQVRLAGLLLCHGLNEEQGSIAEKMWTKPGWSPRTRRSSWTRSSFRNVLRRMNSITKPDSAAKLSACFRISSRNGSANWV